MLSFKELTELNEIKDITSKNIWISLQEGFNISETKFGINFPKFDNYRIKNGRTYFKKERNPTGFRLWVEKV
jgi:hypothetical protein